MKLKIDHVSKVYKKKVLNDICLEIDKPGVYLFAGPNGSGKTTLLEIVAGLRIPDKGSVMIDGYSAGTMEAKRKLGFLCQQNSLRKVIKVKEEMNLIKEVFNVNVDDLEYLIRFNLQEYYTHKANMLSGGTQRRFLTAMLFLSEQECVILDEPASGLDTYSRDEIWNTISEYGKDHIVIVSDHYLNQAEQYSDKIIMLDEGNIVVNDTFDNIKKMCDYDKLIKVRKDRYTVVQNALNENNVPYEVKISGTVYNIYIKDNNIKPLEKLITENASAYHEPELEDLYFYLTGKKSTEGGDM